MPIRKSSGGVAVVDNGQVGQEALGTPAQPMLRPAMIATARSIAVIRRILIGYLSRRRCGMLPLSDGALKHR